LLFFFTGDRQFYFSGDHTPGDHICDCGEDDSCFTNGDLQFKCNCDANYPTWAQDFGTITSKDILPIHAFVYGPLLFEAEMGNFTIGRLQCSGNFLAASTECSAGSNDHFVLVVVVVPSFVQFDGRPLLRWRNHATLQRNNHTTLQHNNHATLQPNNNATLERNNHATLQRNNYANLQHKM
jgi:hypothetical protein